MVDRDKWPVPMNIKSASPRDAFLWHIREVWPKFFDGQVETVLDHDFGFHVLKLGDWELELRNMKEFPKENA